MIWLAAVCGAITTVVGVRVALRSLTGERHVRTNFRGRPVLAPGGVALVVPLVIGGALSAFDDAPKIGLTIAGAGLAMATLGYIDDAYGDRRAGGLLGHARAFVKGTVTTGLLKAGGGAVIGLASAALLGWRGVWGIVAGAAVALASNMGNLLDLRPGRVIKVWTPLSCWLVFVPDLRSGRVVIAGSIAAVVVFVVAEMRETVMLGDTGAGLLGIVLGVAAIAVLSEVGVLVLAGVLLALTLVSERVSFSRVIDAVPPLRFLDRLGRRG